MNKHKQQGSHHVIIIVLLTMLLVVSMGFLFFQNIFPQDIDLNKEHRLSENQRVTIGSSGDTFEITGFSYCPPDAMCAQGNNVFYEIKDSKGVSKTKGNTPYKWDIDIKDSDYYTYAIVKISFNSNWEQELTDYNQKRAESEQEQANLEKREHKRLDERMASAKTVKMNEEFTFYDDNGGAVSEEVYKVADNNVTYYVEGDISPGEVFYYVYKDTMQPNAEGKVDKQSGIVRCEFTTDLPFGKFAMVKTDYNTYATLVASNSPSSFAPKKC